LTRPVNIYIVREYMANLYVANLNDDDYRLLKSQAAKDSLTIRSIVAKLIALYIKGKIKLT